MKLIGSDASPFVRRIRILLEGTEFEFERVYGPDTDQKSLFDDVKPLLTSLLDG